METGHCDDCIFAKRQRGHWFCALREEEVSQEWVCGHFFSDYKASEDQCRLSRIPPQQFSPTDKAAIAAVSLGLSIGIGFCIWGCLS